MIKGHPDPESSGEGSRGYLQGSFVASRLFRMTLKRHLDFGFDLEQFGFWNNLESFRMFKMFKRHLIIFTVFITIGLTIYANALPNDVFWDDDDFLFNNVFVKNPAQYWKMYFTKNVIAGANIVSDYWRPLLLIVYAIEWHFWQADFLAGYHFVSTSWHILNACLLFYLLYLLFKKRTIAFLAALIFLIHPLQTEAVDYVSSMGDMLNVFFVLLGLIFYLKVKHHQPRQARFWIYFLAATLSYIFGLLAKETAIVMFGLAGLIEYYWWRTRQPKIKLVNFIKNSVVNLLPFFMVAVTYLLLRATVLNFKSTFNLYADQITFYSESFSWRLFTFFKVLTVYWRLLILPVGLHMERVAEVADSYFDWSVIFGLIIFLGSIWLALRFWKKRPPYTLAISWFYIVLAPVSGVLIPINAMLYEHWLYLPLVGFWLLIIFAAGDLQKKWPRTRPFLLLILFIFIIFFSVQTIRQNRLWRDPIIFYKNVIKYNDQQLRIWNNLGMEYAERKKFDKAIWAYQRAIELDSANISAPPHHNLAGVYKEQGRVADAEKEYQRALQIDKEFIYSYYGLVGLYFNIGQYEKAVAVLERAAAVFPDNKRILEEIEILKRYKYKKIK